MPSNGQVSIKDPGPPPRDYSCSLYATAHPTAPCKFMAPAERTVIQIMPSSTLTSEPSSVSQQQAGDTSVSSPSPSSDSAAAGVSDGGDHNAASRTSGGLSNGVKAAIAICSIIALLLLLCAAFLLYRRRHRR